MPIQTAIDSISNSQGSPFGFKNRIINGGMVIDQRNAGASYTPVTNTYYLDRWEYEVSQNSKLTGQQNQGSVTPPAGFTNYVGSTSSSAYSVGATDYFLLTQPIEGYNMADLNWGSANAKTVTLSFWVRSSLTGTFGGTLANNGTTRSYPFTYTISSANTWTQASVTIAGDTSGTWLTTNGVGMYVRFSLGTGTTYSGTAGVWSGSLYLSSTGATSVVGTNGATFYITGVQLEKGSQATAFDWRPYTTEQLLCYRYLPVFRANENGSAYSNPIVQGSATALGTNTYMLFHHIVPTRVAPTGLTISAVGDLRFSNNDGNAACTVSGGLASAGIYQSVWTFTVASSRSGSTVPGWFYTGASGFYFYLTGCEL